MSNGAKALLLIGGVITALVAALYFLGGKLKEPPKSSAETQAGNMPAATAAGDSAEKPQMSAIQQELNDRAAKMVAELRQEDRLNLSMVAQLRSYQEMLRQIEGYSQKIEKNIDILEEIAKDEFQEDVKLQAALFTGKKPQLVASHLEEFRASRVGAILAKMKEKEASTVLDVWAKQKSPEVSAFYREVVAAYLNNKRRDAAPALFDQIAENSEATGNEAVQ